MRILGMGLTDGMVAARNVKDVNVRKVYLMAARRLRGRVAGLLAVATLGAGMVSCAAQDQTASEAPTADVDGVPVTAGPNQPEEVNGVDLHFIAMMTPHHEQAVELSEIILAAEGTSAAADDLAERIKRGQREEIDLMVGWADAWEQDELMAHHAPHIANGMLPPEQMDELTSLDGAEADTLFLQLMHVHHEGAIAMTQDQIDNGGYEPLVELAQQMVDIQTAEMQEMEELLQAEGQSLLTD